MRRGGAGLGGAGQDCKPTGLSAQDIVDNYLLNDPSEARTNEIPFKPMGEHNVRFDNQSIRGSTAGRRPLYAPGC